MRRLGIFPLWRRLNFSVKFALIIAVAGCAIAVIPLQIAGGESRVQAAQRAADKAGIVANLLAGQERSLSSFASGMGVELAPALIARDARAVAATLTRYSQINAAGDIVAVHGPLGDAAVRAGSSMARSDPLAVTLSSGATSGAPVVAGPGSAPWLVGATTISGSAEVVFIARPIDAAFLTVLTRTITTSADTASIAIIRDHRVVATGSTVLGQTVANGAFLGDPLATAGAAATSGQTVTVAGRDAGVDVQSLGGGFLAVITTPAAGVSALWQPVAVLLGLIVFAMLIIVAVVQVDLQRPLRRLDRAVSAMSNHEYDAPVPASGNAEIRRLASSFEEMRRELRLTVVGTEARAVIASALNSPQPLGTALDHVCAQMRETLGGDAAFIMVTGSEMTDSFAVSDGLATELDVPDLISHDGPIGTAYRHVGPGALIVGAAPSSHEYRTGLRDFIAAPLRMGPTVLGVLGVARNSGDFNISDAGLIATSAEQVTLALERYRFIAMVQRQASTDDLTGLHNHRFLVDYLGQQVALAERMNTPLAVLIMDLDHFKRVNDTYGHPVGDAVLQAFAKTLTGSIRRADLAARYGGEEFIVVMANTAAADARRVAEKIRTAVEGIAVPVDDNHIVTCTVSIGGAAYPEDTTTARELLATADAALYDAKRAGRNRVRMAGSDGESEVLDNVAVLPRRSAK